MSRGSTQSSCCVLHRGSWRPCSSWGRGVSSPYSDVLPLGGWQSPDSLAPLLSPCRAAGSRGAWPRPLRGTRWRWSKSQQLSRHPHSPGMWGPQARPPSHPAEEASQVRDPQPPTSPPLPCPRGRKPTPAGPGALGPNRHSACTQGVTSGASESLVTVTVQCALTLTLTAPRGADLSSLRALMSQALPRHTQHAQLRWARTTWQGGEGALGWAPLGHALQEGRAHQRLSRSEVSTLRSRSST